MSTPHGQIVSTGPCEVVDALEFRRIGRPRPRFGLPCGHHGRGLQLTTTRDGHDLGALGRRVVAGPYCDAHGGVDRAREEALAAWDYLAPASVGDSAAVAAAGAAALTSRAVYVVVRREGDERVPTLWRVRLGRAEVAAATRALGLPPDTPHQDRRVTAVAPGVADFLDQRAARRRIEALAALGVAAEAVEVQGRSRPRPRPWLALLGLGGFSLHVGAFATEGEAEAAGRAAWRERLDADLAAIRDARGGTLDWGLPVQPREEPEVLRPAPGETGWDLAASGRRD